MTQPKKRKKRKSEAMRFLVLSVYMSVCTLYMRDVSTSGEYYQNKIIREFYLIDFKVSTYKLSVSK